MGRLKTWHLFLALFLLLWVVFAFGRSVGISDTQARWNDNYLNALQADRIQRQDNLRWFRAYVERWDRIMHGPSHKMLVSWYGIPFHGRTAADGSTYDMYAPTCASLEFPLGTRLMVQNLDRPGKAVVLTCTDRGPFVPPRTLDISYAGAMALDMVGDGVAVCRVTPIPIDRPVTPGMKEE